MFGDVMINTDKIDDVEIDGLDMSDYPDFVDAYISRAWWDNGSELNSAELDLLNDDRDFVYQKVLDYLY